MTIEQLCEFPIQCKCGHIYSPFYVLCPMCKSDEESK